MNFKQLAAASLAAAAVLSTAACGGDSPESNSRAVIEHLLAGEKQESYEYMTDAYAEHAQDVSATDLLGNERMIDCELGEGATVETGDPAMTTFPLNCPEGDFQLEVTTAGDEHLVDDIGYNA